MRQVYLDHAASTPLRRRAREILIQGLEEDFANPEAAHRLGRSLRERLERARLFFLEALEAPSHGRFVFTGSATESNNTFLQGILSSSREEEITLFSSADHPGLCWPLYRPSAREIPLLPQGAIDFPQLQKLLQLKPLMIGLAHINNHSGNLHPIRELGKLIKEISPSTLFFVDASQSFGKVPLSLQDGTIDGLTLSAHKMGGPKGMAGLYLHPRVKIPPLLRGGGQEQGLRSSTPCFPLIASWEAAAREALKELEPARVRTSELATTLKTLLLTKIPQWPHLQFPFGPDPAHFGPYIFTFVVPKIPSDVLIRHLEEKNIFVSSSSACSSRIKGKSPVFTALHLPPQFHKHVLRLSFSQETTLEDIQDFVTALESCLRDLSLLFQPQRNRHVLQHSSH